MAPTLVAHKTERVPILPVQTTDKGNTYRNGSYVEQPFVDVVWAPAHGRYVSEEEYWRFYYEHNGLDDDASYEWNNGILEAKPLPNKMQFLLYKWFFMLLDRYLSVYQQADMFALETGFRLEVPDPKKPNAKKTVVRKPDIAVVRHDNSVRWGDNERSYKGICDLCVEAVSDSEKSEVDRDSKSKKLEYAFAGVQEYYILDPSHENMHFYRRVETGEYVEILPNADGVIRSSVLPGFQFRLTDLDRQPTLAVLAMDVVYQGYVLPEYRAAVMHAEAERQRAERYAAKLRELGIHVEDL